MAGHGGQANMLNMNNSNTTGGIGSMQIPTFSGSMVGVVPGMGMQSSSTSTIFVNGKKVTTMK